MRQLKFHERKLLKKTDFLDWKRERGHREAIIMGLYHVTGRDDYKKYSKICSMVQKLVHILKQMDPKDPYRIDMTDKLLQNLFWIVPDAFWQVATRFDMGVITTRKSLTVCDHLSVSSFCRRRLATVLVQKKYAEYPKEAVTY